MRARVTRFPLSAIGAVTRQAAWPERHESELADEGDHGDVQEREPPPMGDMPPARSRIQPIMSGPTKPPA
jgi:hypothetical protein